MARHEVVLYKDDIDGSEKDVRTVAFEFDGASYEIDLGPANYTKLKKALTRYVEAGTKVSNRARTSGRSLTARRSVAKDQKEFNVRIRRWAAENGYDVKPRGRVPETVIAAYNKAGKK
jgi:Lsr2